MTETADGDDDGNALLVLLNGIFSIDYDDDNDEGDAEINELKSRSYPNLSSEEFRQLQDKMSQLIRTMASSDMDLKQTEAFLTSQTKRREGKISETQASTLAKFWKVHRSRIHDTIVRRSTFGTAVLKGLSWRVEVPTHHGRSKSNYDHEAEDPLTPVAVVQMKCRSQQRKQRQTDDGKHTTEDSSFNFELNEKDLASLLRSMDEIDAQITAMSC